MDTTYTHTRTNEDAQALFDELSELLANGATVRINGYALYSRHGVPLHAWNNGSLSYDTAARRGSRSGVHTRYIKAGQPFEVEIILPESEPEDDDAGPTYHGIVMAQCLSCGYCTTSRSTLELWNDYGVDCIECDQDGEAGSHWWMDDGSITYIRGELRIDEKQEVPA